jgi:WD40 repeat protein
MSDVFISYSRKDIAFARLIRESLQASQIDTWIDWERIPVGERWWDEICQAIENANVFMFIISKNSVGSSVCKDEINHALKNNKRIIPIIVDDLQPEAIKEFAPDLPQFNWIIFERNQLFRIEENPEVRSDKPEDSQVALPKLPQFEEALGRLSKAIHTDWEWVKYHTRLQVNALLWESNQRNPSYLVRGTALEESEQQLLRATGKDPQPTGLQVEYVTTSRQEETLRQTEKLRLEQKARGRQRLVIWAVGIGLVVSLVMGVVAWGQRNQYLSETHVRATAEVNAVNQQMTAEAASTLAVQQSIEAQHQAKIALSGQLSAQSQTQLAHQLDLAMLLAGESYLTADTYHSRSSLLLALEQSPQLARIYRYPEKITALAFTPDGKWIAAAGCAQRDANHDACLKNEIVFYDLPSGQTGRVLAAGQGQLTGLAFTPDGSVLFVAIANDRVYRFDLSAADQPAPVPLPAFAHSSGTVVISPDGKYMASAGCDFSLIPGGLCSQGGIILWDLNLANPTGLVLKGVGNQLHNLAFSPHSDRLYAGDCASLRTENFDKTSQDYCQTGEVKTWNLSDGSMQVLPVEGTTSAIVATDVSADGTLLAAGEAAGTVHIMDLASWKQVASYNIGLDIQSLVFSRAGDGQILASLSFGHSIEIHYASNSGGDPLILEPYQSSRFVNAMAISPDGRLLASASCIAAGLSLDDCKQSQIYLWNLISPQPVAQVFNSSDPSEWNNWQVGFDPSAPETPIVVASSSSGIVAWDVEKNLPAGRPFITFNPAQTPYDPNYVPNIFLSHSGKVLVFPELIQDKSIPYPFKSSTRMHFWDVATRQAISTPITIDGWALDAIFSPDDRWIVSDGPEGTLLVWDSSTGQVDRQMKMNVNSGFINMAFSPDGETLAVAGCIQGLIECQTYRIEMYDIESGKTTGKPFEGSTNGHVNQLGFSPDGKKIGISTYTGLNLVDTWWDIASGQVDAQMSNLAVGQFNPDGNYMVSTRCENGNNSNCGIGLITLWDVQKLEPVGQPIINPDENVTILSFSPDSRFLYTFGTGKMTVWSMDPQDWLTRICQIANYNLTKAEWSTYLDQVGYHATCELAP